MEHELEYELKFLQSLLDFYSLDELVELYSDFEVLEVLEHLILVGFLSKKNLPKVDMDFT